MKEKVEKENIHLILLRRVKYWMERDDVCLKTNDRQRLPVLGGEHFYLFKGKQKFLWQILKKRQFK